MSALSRDGAGQGALEIASVIAVSGALRGGFEQRSGIGCKAVA